jgi:hypothetical protein
MILTDSSNEAIKRLAYRIKLDAEMSEDDKNKYTNYLSKNFHCHKYLAGHVHWKHSSTRVNITDRLFAKDDKTKEEKISMTLIFHPAKGVE